MQSRSTPTIALNGIFESNGKYFMSLDTSRRICGSYWTEKLINKDMIDRVHSLAWQKGQPHLFDNCPMFQWSPGVPIEDDEEQEDNIKQEPLLVDD